MLKINTAEIKLNYKEIQKITEITKSTSAKNLTVKYSNLLKNQAIPKMPVGTNHKKRVPPLHQSFIVTEPKLKKININIHGNKYKTESWKVIVKPKKRQVYYFVTMSGKNTYKLKDGSTIKKNLQYSKSSAIKFPLETTYKKIKKGFENEFIEIIKKAARD